MTSTAVPSVPMSARLPWSRIATSALTVALLDGLFAIVFYCVVLRVATFARLWQGVASKAIGPASFTGGTPTVLLGLLMHLTVALAWTLVFAVAVRRSAALRGVVTSRYGALKVAAWYGPLVHIVMTCAVIPVMTHKPPTIAWPWFVALLAHIVFVGLPIATIIGNANDGA